MRLEELLRGIDYQVQAGKLEQDISGINYDSRKIKRGDLFICIPGLKTDGHEFVEKAISKGAKALLVERDVSVQSEVAIIQTADCRLAMPVMASNFFGHPSKDIKVIGVTGTNGKTTTTHLIKAILEEQGSNVGIMGTLYAKMGDYEKPLVNTTPESVDIADFMSLVREKKGDYLVMEVSSHALDMGRVDGILFHSAVFTNLTQDHLDYHLTMKKYQQSKLKLFKMVSQSNGTSTIINADDPVALDFIGVSKKIYSSYSIDNEADVKVVDLKSSLKGSYFTVVYQGGSFDIKTRLIGRFNVYNALAAICFALKEGIDPKVIKSAMEKVAGIAGRFEEVDCGQDFTVIVDYAHTPDGLENILKTGRHILENRLITVFGCGGDRDKTKRPLMGKIAAQYSDFCIVTSDNPRSEEPEAIIDDIIPGITEVESSHYAKIIDRREAIHQAIALARKGDLVIIAGKGHETYQLVKEQVLHFDDREVAAEFLRGKLQT